MRRGLEAVPASSPTWKAFSALFADGEHAPTRSTREAFLRRHGLVSGFQPSDEAYLDAFASVHAIALDWKEGTLSLLEYMQDQLGSDVLSIEPSSDDSRVRVRAGTRRCVFHEHEVGSDGFEYDIERIGHLLADRFAFRMIRRGGISDTLEFLFVPADWWARAEMLHGKDRVAADFVPYGGAIRLADAPVPAARSRRQGVLPRLFLIFVVPVSCVVVLAVWQSRQPATPQRVKCEDVDKVFSKLPPAQAEAARTAARRQSGCE